MRKAARAKSVHQPVRCPWVTADPDYIRYHDLEWGVPVHDDTKLFEMLVLEGFQAGLSWLTVLKKRERFREAFDQWDLPKIAAYSEKDLERLMNTPGIIRNYRKILSAVNNARAFMKIQEKYGSFDAFLWRFTGGVTRVARPRPKTLADIPVKSRESEALSNALKKKGFQFVGPVICYSYMQACGLVDDHVADCFKARPQGGGK